MTVLNGLMSVLMFATLVAAGAAGVAHGRQQQALVVESLEPAYSSCAVVTFDVRNTSTQDLYVEVFPENFSQGSWKDVGCPYDLKDPRRRGVKRIHLDPPMLKPGASIRVSYDRCSDYEWCVAPTFRKGDVRARRQTLEQQDRASSPVQQRVRVDLYRLDGRSLHRTTSVASKPFERRAEVK